MFTYAKSICLPISTVHMHRWKSAWAPHPSPHVNSTSPYINSSCVPCARSKIYAMATFSLCSNVATGQFIGMINALARGIIILKFSDDHFSYYYSPCHYMHEGMDTHLACAQLLCTRCSDTWAEPEKICTTRLRIGQNCRAVCTKKSGPDCTEVHCCHNITRSGDIGIIGNYQCHSSFKHVYKRPDMVHSACSY